MYVIVSLDDVYPPVDMFGLTYELSELLGVHFDKLVLVPKSSPHHASWARVHTGGSSRRGIDRDTVLAAIVKRLPEVAGIEVVHHVGGIPHDLVPKDAQVYVRF